jgi:hypothetical protein
MAAKKRKSEPLQVPTFYTWPERRKLSGDTGLDLRTVLKWEAGKPVRDSVNIALVKAARALKLMVPGHWVKKTMKEVT